MAPVERVEAALIASVQFRLPEKRVVQEAQTVYSIVEVDASEVPYERPEKWRRWYRGKNKRNTLQLQMLLGVVTQRILGAATSAVHDLKLFRSSGMRFLHGTALIGDAGYQGLWRSHRHAIIPTRRSERRLATKHRELD